MNFTDTIAAISTPIGEGGIGIVRISGDDAKNIAQKILVTKKGKPFGEFAPHKMYYGKVFDHYNNQIIDEVLFFYAQKPKSFTSEDVMEIQAHGGMLILSKILKLILNNGARLAEPGEFTLRAYFNGRIDLVQAESIIDLIRAKNDKAHQLAINQLSGLTSKEINKIEADLYQILITMEAVLDFPEEGIPDLEKIDIINRVNEIKEDLVLIINNIDEGRKIREGISIVIVGRPNVGKSSLLNAFLQEEKAIVTDIPGTTRDVIEAQIQLKGVPIVLIDTAGVRETDNIIEKMGIDKTEKYINTANLVLLVIDGSDHLTDEDQLVISKIKDQKLLVVINKTDLPQKVTPETLNALQIHNIVELSSLTGSGLDQLEAKIVEMVGIGELTVDDRPMLSRIRHKQALEESLSALNNFVDGLNNNLSEDLLVVDLRSALSALGEITGKSVSDEVIHGIFANFCIGK